MMNVDIKKRLGNHPRTEKKARNSKNNNKVVVVELKNDVVSFKFLFKSHLEKPQISGSKQKKFRFILFTYKFYGNRQTQQIYP